MRITSSVLMVAFFCGATLVAEEAVHISTATNAVTFRKPFTLKLNIDKDRYYEESYTNEIPYVYANDVYLFCGESFGIRATIEKDKIVTVSYQREPKTADVEFKFSQEKMDDGKVMTMLVIRNRLAKRLYVDALMTMPEKSGIVKTSIMPIEPGLSSYESWPHPIIQLVLRNLRFEKVIPNQRDHGTR